MIGIFDSGLGGLSVLSALFKKVPRARFVYFADSGHLPYGDKSDHFIRDRLLKIAPVLAQQGCKQIVIACNTATAAGASALREHLPHIDIIGTEPGIKPAAITTKTGRIAVLATQSTAQSARLAGLVEKHAKDIDVRILACPGWATQVETLNFHTPQFIAQVKARIEPLLDDAVDRIVLGCTHYTFLTPLFESIIQGRAHIVDIADAVAAQCLRLARPETLENTDETLQFISTGDPQKLEIAVDALGLQHLRSSLKSRAQFSPL